MKNALALLILALSMAFGFCAEAQSRCQDLPENDCVVACGQSCGYKRKVPQNFQIELPTARTSPSQEKGKFNISGTTLPNHARPLKLPFTMTLPSDFYDVTKAGTDIEIKQVPYSSNDTYLIMTSSVRLSTNTPIGQAPSFAGTYTRCNSFTKNGPACPASCTPNWVDLACSSTVGVRNTKDGCGATDSRNDLTCTTPAVVMCSSPVNLNTCSDGSVGVAQGSVPSGTNTIYSWTCGVTSCSKTVASTCTPNWVDLGCSSTAGERNTKDGCGKFVTRLDLSCTVPIATDCVGIWGACTGTCGADGSKTFTVLLTASLTPPGKACPKSPDTCTMPACVTCSSPVSRNTCSDGSAGLAPNSLVSGTSRIYTWFCGGNSCLEAVPISPPPPVLGKVDGSCNNSILNACASGILQTAAGGTWVCKGDNGGSDSGTCQVVAAAPPNCGIQHSAERTCVSGESDSCSYSDLTAIRYGGDNWITDATGNLECDCVCSGSTCNVLCHGSGAGGYE